MVLQSLQGLPAFAIYFIVASVLVAAYLYAYTWITAHDEFALLKANNTSAAIALGLSMIGFALPLTSSIGHADGVVDMTIWGVIALIVQIGVYYRGAHSGAGPVASASRRARSRPRSGSAPPRSRPACSTPPRWVRDAVKRSAQVALVLMGVTGATAAGAYLMPARSAECRQPARRPAPAAAPVPGATPRAQEEPCRRRRSWGSWHWGSGSYSYDRSRRNSTIAPSTAFRSSPSSGTRSTSTSTSASTSTSSPARPRSSSRGGFGSTIVRSFELELTC